MRGLISYLKVNLFSVSYGGQKIKSSKVAKYLRVTLDETLNWKSIAQDIIIKAGVRLIFFYRQTGNLIRALHGIPDLSQHFKNRPQTMQNKVVRFILD